MNVTNSRSSKFATVVALVTLLAGCGGLRTPATTADDLPRLTADELFAIALFQARRGDFFRAEQYLVAAEEEGYDARITTYWLVRVCVLANRYHSALLHAHEHLRRSPGDWSLRLVVASIHEALGEVGRALEELEGVVRAAPDQAVVHYRLGLLHSESGSSRQEARIHFRRYLDLEPLGAHSAEVRANLERWADTPPVVEGSASEPQP